MQRILVEEEKVGDTVNQNEQKIKENVENVEKLKNVKNIVKH